MAAQIERWKVYCRSGARCQMKRNGKRCNRYTPWNYGQIERRKWVCPQCKAMKEDLCRKAA